MSGNSHTSRINTSRGYSARFDKVSLPIFQADHAAKVEVSEVEKVDGGVLVDDRHLWGPLFNGVDVKGTVCNVDVGRLRGNSRTGIVNGCDVTAEAIEQDIEVDANR